MADNPDNKIYSAADIERYHKGEMTPQEMHAFEKAALEDPFLADAIEGYATIPAAHQQLPNLHRALAEKTASKKGNFSWMKVAAALIVTIGAGLLIYQASQHQQQNETASKETLQNAVTVDTSIKTNDSGLVTVPITDTQSTDVAFQSVTRNENAGTLILDSLPKEWANNVPASSVRDSAVSESAPSVANIDMYSNRKNPDTLSLNYKDSRYGNSISAANRAAEKEAMREDSEKFISGEKKTKVAGITRLNVFRGQIVDRNNNPLPFANITNNADNVGTYSDARGNFNLASLDSVLTVNVRSIGFENTQQRISSSQKLNSIILDEDTRTVSVDTFSHKPANALARSADKRTQVIEEHEPADGWMNYDTYLLNNRDIPDSYRPTLAQTQSREVEVSFEVDKNGEPIRIRVEKSLCAACDAEAIRLVKEGPKWKRKGKKRVTVKVPF